MSGVTVSQMKRKFEEARSNISVYATEIINASESHLTGYVKSQLMQGKDGKGNYLKPYASADYARYKLSLNPLGVTDLRLTGSFHEKMVLEWLTPESFSVISQDVKWRKLIKQYGIDTLKLSEESIQYFRINRFNPLFIKEISRVTGAGIG